MNRGIKIRRFFVMANYIMGKDGAAKLGSVRLSLNEGSFLLKILLLG